VWKVKEHKKEKTAKRVSFAVPIASELKAPKITIPDDGIMLIKGTLSVPPQVNEVDPAVTDCFMLNYSCPVDGNTTQNDSKKKEGGQGGHTATVVNTDTTAMEGMQNNAFTRDFNIVTPSEKNNDVASNAVGVEVALCLILPPSPYLQSWKQARQERSYSPTLGGSRGW
jgi:hypothetical protein